MQTLGRVGPYILSQFMYPPCLWFVLPAETSHRQHSHEVIPIKNSWAQPDTDASLAHIVQGGTQRLCLHGNGISSYEQESIPYDLGLAFCGLGVPGMQQ